MDRDPFGKPINRRQLLKSAALGVAAVQLAPRGLASAMAAQPLPDDVAVTEGTLTAAGEGWLEILLDNHEQRFSYTAGASFWKGGESLPGALALGDDVMVRTAVSSGRVLRVWSNLSRIGGQVIGRQQGGYVLRVNNHHAPPGDLLLELTAGTQFGNLATYGMGGPGGVLSEGDLVDAIGEQTPEGLRATLAYVARPDSASNTVTPPQRSWRHQNTGLPELHELHVRGLCVLVRLPNECGVLYQHSLSLRYLPGRSTRLADPGFVLQRLLPVCPRLLRQPPIVMRKCADRARLLP